MSMFTTCINVQIKVHSKDSAVKLEDLIVKPKVRNFSSKKIHQNFRDNPVLAQYRHALTWLVLSQYRLMH